jgi:hypothetical protein
MQARNIRPIHFQSGEVWPKGTLIEISMSDSPKIAILKRVDGKNESEKPYGIYSSRLHRYFNEFIEYTYEDLEEAVRECICPSLTGEYVEPDGWDSKGFPSLLKALGYI